MVDQGQITFNDDTMYVQGNVDFGNVVALRDRGDSWLRGSAPPTCHVNLSKLSHCNSAATTLLLSWLRTAAHSGKSLSIHQVPSSLQSLMQLGGLENLLLE